MLHMDYYRRNSKNNSINVFSAQSFEHALTEITKSPLGWENIVGYSRVLFMKE